MYCAVDRMSGVSRRVRPSAAVAALLALMVAGIGSPVVRADETRSTEPETAASIHIVAGESSDVGSPTDPAASTSTTLQVVADDAPDDPRQSRSRPITARSASPIATSAAEPESVEDASPQPVPSKESPLEPIPDGATAGPPPVGTASFNGITPGVSTVAELEDSWGAPQEIRKHEGVVIHRYVVEPFDHIEVVLAGDKVGSIVVRLQKAFPAKAVAEQLELSNVEPVLISNELGDILGEAFPERGVLFAFQQNHEPGEPSMNVTEIVLEPVSADSFVLRAETHLESRYAASLRDLDEALTLTPDLARAHWLRARVLAAMGRSEEALNSAIEAVRFERENARFLITLSQVLEQTGRHDEAIEAAQAAVSSSEDRPHVRARAICLLGDLASTGSEPDYAAALEHHMQAIKLADRLALDRHPAIRLAAKEVLIDAHLGAATDIAWGPWAEKEKAVIRWSQRAAAFAEELIANDGGTNEHRFRVATRALAACVGAGGGLDPTDWAKEAVRVGQEMIDQAEDPIQKQQLQSELGMALFNAAQIYQIRGQNDLTLQFGERGAAYLEAARESEPPGASQDYILGRLYFRLGAIHALDANAHEEAVAWFDKAAPLLQAPAPHESLVEIGRQGETLVSMGVSYWEVGRQDEAMQLTRKGLTLIKQAVESGAMDRAALTVPYENLAAMQRHLGEEESAGNLEGLADDARGSDDMPTAKQPRAPLQR